MFDNKKEIIQRLKIARGHLQAIIFMVNKNQYCIDIAQQIRAVKGALRKIDCMILEKYLKNGGNFFRGLKVIKNKN